MIGRLTIDKASMNLSYFLYTLKIINDNNGRVSRREFGKQMGDFIGMPSVKGGKENRTPYNKSKLPRYFGFVDIEYGHSNENILVLTHRGKILVNYIEDRGEEKEADKRYGIKKNNRDDFIDLIFESVIFDSFGKNNCGAEQSKTDVEPPKIVFKTILELGRATAEEICFVMFGLNFGIFKSFEEAIEVVKNNRNVSEYDYKSITDQWQITNIVNDCKIINIFTDSNIRLLTSQRDEQNNKIYYSLSKTLDDVHKEQIRTIGAIYKPLRLYVYTNGNIETIHKWIDDVVLGRVSDNTLVFRYNNYVEFCSDYSKTGALIPGVFEKALLTAFNEEKKNVYIVLEGTTETMFRKRIGGLLPLMKSKDDFLAEDHGWSINSVKNERLYNYLVTNSTNAKNVLKDQMVRLPSNIHIIGAIMMTENDKNLEFDYVFQRCFVNAKDNAGFTNSNANKAIIPSSNILLYGVPGCGKSHKVEEEYESKITTEKNKVRVVFHPDYTYSDFVGQLLPVLKEVENAQGVKEEKLQYEFVPGPFTKIIKTAYEEPNQQCLLIIEELNRGNAPAIFGEIFQLLDRNDNGESKYGIYNADIAKYAYGGLPENQGIAINVIANTPIKLPPNLTIVATMNTSDQNVFTMDTAFQRRWQMKHIPNRFTGESLDEKTINHIAKHLPNSEISWGVFAQTINKKMHTANLGFGGTEDKSLGVYFATDNDLDDAERFAEKVLKYLWDDAFKLGRKELFNDCSQGLSAVIEAYEDAAKAKIEKQSAEDPLKKVLVPEVYNEMQKKMAEMVAEQAQTAEEKTSEEEAAESTAEDNPAQEPAGEE